MRNRILPLTRKETLHILRDPRSLYLAIVLPVVLLILFGYAITFDVRHIPVGIIDQDSSFLSRDFISRVKGSEYLDLVYLSNSSSGLESLLDKGKVKAILIIPHRFSRDLSKGKDAPLQLLIDGSDNNTAQIALGYISGIVQIFSSNIILEKLNKQGAILQAGILPIDVRPRIWYNPDLSSTNFIVPGLIAVVMMILAAMSTSLTIAREWEIGTMEQLIATPAKPHEIIIGKLIPYFFLGIIQISLVVLVGTLLFNVPLKGNIFFLFCVSGVFLICGLGIGVLISTITRSQQLAFMFSVLFTFLPSFLLSGFIFPISSMPRIIQFFTYLVPAKYFLIVLRGIFLKGTGLTILWPEVVSLFAFASLILLACAKRLRLSLE
ncbi:MAG: ABC transporter permease [Candidatus Aminicenantes bacterium]|nr:ABC transporter permease [Candidatus Aminicenantes bacterium]